MERLSNLLRVTRVSERVGMKVSLTPEFLALTTIHSLSGFANCAEKLGFSISLKKLIYLF